MIQLLLHLFGDYFLQSDWMALDKDKDDWRCFVHVILYTFPFLLITQSTPVLFIILSTHFFIDRYGLVKYLIYLKNHINPSFSYYPWKYCNETGYLDKVGRTGNNIDPCIRPKFITVWLYIISDNTLHLACNFFALHKL
jgi:hypothetical protein